MTRSLEESREYIIHHIDRTLSFLGLSPADVEVILSWKDSRFVTVNWSAQTSLGDMVGTFPVPIYAALDGYACRQAVAETALAKLHSVECER